MPRSKFFLNPYLVVELVLVLASCSNQQNIMVSTLNVLLLTLNKALPGGRPRIARVSLMVRIMSSFNKL